LVRERENENLVGSFMHNYGVRKSPEQEALHAALAGESRQCNQGNTILLKQVKGSI